MPEFKFRNLTVKVGDTVANCLNNTQIPNLTPILCRRFYTQIPCRFPTVRDTLTPITDYTLCRFHSIDFTDLTNTPCGFSYDPPYVLDLDLDQLKQQLVEQLKVVEVEQAKEAAAAKPTTVEEVDALKVQLKEAMAELDAHRAELAKGDDA